MANRITLIDHIKGVFAKDKYAYWFHHFTDEEKELRRMDAWQLARVINEAGVHNGAGEAEKLIVAKYMLNVRLVRLQNRAVLVAAIFSVIGVAIGAFITSRIQQPQNVECVYQHATTATPNNSVQNSGSIDAKAPIQPKPIQPQNNGQANEDSTKEEL